ncbi:MAG: putative membrane protein [Maribacter sp.]|jgi:uncharacterized membrane protein
MLELLNEAVNPANLVYTILLGLAILYALSVIIGFAGMDAIDFDIDIDADVDVDVDTDVNGGGLFIQMLSFFNLGKVPFMIIYSITTLSMWTIGMIFNYSIGNEDIILTLATFIPVLFVSLIITKLITTPLVPVFKSMNEGVEAVDYIGLEGTLLLSISSSEKSQAEISINGDIHKISVSLNPEDNSNLAKGTPIYITGISEDKSFYWISKNDII